MDECLIWKVTPDAAHGTLHDEAFLAWDSVFEGDEVDEDVAQLLRSYFSDHHSKPDGMQPGDVFAFVTHRVHLLFVRIISITNDAFTWKYMQPEWDNASQRVTHWPPK